MTPQVSVIIASYNAAPYIKMAIESALAQQGVTLEVIVADDASTDDSWEIISAISDPRVKSLHFSTNQGPGAARNAAISQARGQWIAILDGDDMFIPGRLARCIKLAEALTADIIVDNIHVAREADGSEFLMFPSTSFTTLLLDHAHFIAGNTTSRGYTLGYVKPIFSAAFFKAHALRYDTDIRIGEDYIVLATALAQGARCIMEPEAGYCYRARTGSTSYRLTSEDIAHIMAADTRYLREFFLDLPTALAQEARTQSLKISYAFALLVEAMKSCNIAGIIHAIRLQPRCLLLLWNPIVVRFKRFL